MITPEIVRKEPEEKVIRSKKQTTIVGGKEHERTYFRIITECGEEKSSLQEPVWAGYHRRTVL